MRSKIVPLAIAVFTAMALTGCPKPPDNTDDEDAGGPPPDVCNSKDDAVSNSACQLTLGTAVQDYIGTPGDQDWYSFVTPATATARTLVHVTAGYGAPNTAVSLSVNILREDGTTSLARGVDIHGQAKPKPVDLIFPFAEANTRLLVLLGDQPAVPTRPQYDARNPYSLMAEVVENPDVNEPNDTTPTPVTLAASGAVQQGTSTGYLATPDDVDKFAVTVPSGSDILYVSLTGTLPTHELPYRLSFQIQDSTGTSIAEGRMDNGFEAFNLATARKIQPGNYTIVVQGYRDQSTTGSIGGDLSQSYLLTVMAMKDQDTNEPNDTAATAKTVSFSGPDTSQGVTGRLAYVPDTDWYNLQFPANASPTALHWKLAPTNNGGRFPALPTVPVNTPDRQVRILKPITTANAASDCVGDPNVCPKNYEQNPLNQSLVEGYCQESSGAKCLLAGRQEALADPNLKNFEGVLQIPPHASTYSLLLLVQDDQNNWADDKDYALTLEWQSDADEAARYSGGTEQPQVMAMSVDSAAASFPAPPSSATTLTGTIWGGFGRLYQLDPNMGQGVRGPSDYEAVPTDIDHYEIDLPSVAAPEDRTWELQWSVDKDNGQTVHDIALEVRFCDGSGGNCQLVPSATNDPLLLAYTGASLKSWHGQSTIQPVYDQVDSTTSVTTTVKAYGCFCFERRFMQGGKLFVNVTGIDREAYVPVPYHVKMAITDYPKTYAGVAPEGTLTCPAPVATPDGGWDGGCGFE